MEWVYPKLIKEYLEMEELRKKGKVQMYLEIFCGNCWTCTGERYKTYISIPEETVFPECKQKISKPYITAKVIYKKIVD